jgi:hypothetical protein
VLAAAKRKSDYRPQLAPSGEFSAQLHNIENFTSELAQILDVMHSSQGTLMVNTYGQYMTSMKDTTQVSGGVSSGVCLNSDESNTCRNPGRWSVRVVET